MTLVMAFGEGEEFQLCIRCRANLRYELLARYLRLSFPDLSGLDVLELDYGSPIRGILARARTYTRSFYRDNVAPGTVRGDGAVCQDITRLTYADASLDLIVSSDVLEHVPDVGAAFRESARVLRPGGVHVFTVPPLAATSRRAKIENGRVVHIASPEYHSDPLDPAGVLAFWDFGPDLAEKFPDTGLDIRVTLGPEGVDQRIVWEARKTRG
jgi:SAM-dependent methyltransferase